MQAVHFALTSYSRFPYIHVELHRNWYKWVKLTVERTIEPHSLILISGSIPECYVITLQSSHAFIRHQILVCFVMCRQRGVSIECFFTNLAFKGSLVGVDDLVSTQRAGQSKTFPTSWTSKRSVTGVFRHSHMLFESVLGFKDSPTIRAVVFKIIGFSKQLVSMKFPDETRKRIDCISMGGHFWQVLGEAGHHFIGNWFTTHFLSMSFNSYAMGSNFFQNSWSSSPLCLFCIQKKRVNVMKGLRGMPVHTGNWKWHENTPKSF